jgi:hypothetical protein
VFRISIRISDLRNLNAYPGMDQTRQETESTKGDVDERVCATNTALDPYCGIVSNYAREVAEDAVRVPAIGGKRIARKARKTSLESHMVVVDNCKYSPCRMKK